MTIPLSLLKPTETAKKTQDRLQVHLGIPTFDDRLQSGILTAVYGASQTPLLRNIQVQANSWLQRNFNACLAAALNQRATGTTHFCLLHEDVIPSDPDWLERMVAIAEDKKADVLSVVVPLKIGLGLTSTALDEPVGDMDPRWRVKRLTLHEIYNDFEPTFTHPKLLLNTGLMLIDLRKPWVDNIWFEFEDRIIKDKDGKFVDVGVPEDWHFSRKARAAGASIWATREVKVTHMGKGAWPNDHAWGTQKADQ